MSEEEDEYFERQGESIEEVVRDANATYRKKLEALRDFVAHELEANLCKTCFNSRLRTGDTAALVLRLRSLLEDIEGLPDPDAEEDDFDRLINAQPDWGSEA